MEGLVMKNRLIAGAALAALIAATQAGAQTASPALAGAGGERYTGVSREVLLDELAQLG